MRKRKSPISILNVFGALRGLNGMHCLVVFRSRRITSTLRSSVYCTALLTEHIFHQLIVSPIHLLWICRAEFTINRHRGEPELELNGALL